MRKTVIVHTIAPLARAALLWEDRLAAFALNEPCVMEPKDVYLGKIVRDMPSLSGAFADVGGATVFVSYAKEEERKQEGDLLLLQIEQQAFAQKEAKASVRICLDDGFLSYRPVSRNSYLGQTDGTDKKCKILGNRGFTGAWVVSKRAEALGTSEILERANALRARYQEICGFSGEDSTPRLLYKAGGKYQTFLQEVAPTADELITDDIALIDYFHTYFPAVKTRSLSDLSAWDKLDAQLNAAFERAVSLPSGAEIVIDQTEACVLIDVNSGDKNNGKDKRANALAVNTEAAKEIALQLSLRNLGGSILVDFITLSGALKTQVTDALRAACAQDEAPVRVYDGFTKLGFAELTRKRVYAPATLDPRLKTLWKLRRDVQKLYPLCPARLLLKYAEGLESTLEWGLAHGYLDFPFPVECEVAEVPEYVLQLL